MKNNYILITGATSTLGQHIVASLAPTRNLIIHGQSEKHLKELKNKMIKKKNIIIWKCDLNNLEIIKEKLQEKSKKIFISDFIHCAGTLQILKIKDFTKDSYLKIFNINFFSSIEIIKTLRVKKNVKKLKNIIFISALYSKYGAKYNSIYASSKGALNSFCKSLAVELAPVKVNCILPGSIKSKMTKNLYNKKDYKDYLNKKYLIKKGGAKEIANLVNFMVSSESWITGQEIIIDGGASTNLN